MSTHAQDVGRYHEKLAHVEEQIKTCLGRIIRTANTLGKLRKQQTRLAKILAAKVVEAKEARAVKRAPKPKPVPAVGEQQLKSFDEPAKLKATAADYDAKLEAAGFRKNKRARRALAEPAGRD